MKSKIILCLSLFSLLFNSQASAKCNCSMWVRIYNDGVPTQIWAGMNSQLVEVFIAPGDSLKFYVNSNYSCACNGLLFTFNGDTLFNNGAGDPDPGYSYVAV